MATFFEDLEVWLGKFPNVTVLIQNDDLTLRFYRKKLPTNPDFPALVATRISEPRQRTQDGLSNLIRHVWQFTCWATTLKGADILADTLTAEISEYRGIMGSRMISGVKQLSRLDSSETDTDLEAQIMDFAIYEQ